ncbi:MAG: SUMF1/EgtB/PvdO family nonheme iron enzyme [Chitinispirillaceae bacterium]|nr:SUMF1/EgtB/PvdO family nonheme iron enzyme [Chitinispirillaceae bacterium]
MTDPAKKKRSFSRRTVLAVSVIAALIVAAALLLLINKRPDEEKATVTAPVSETVDTIKPVIADTSRPVVPPPKKIPARTKPVVKKTRLPDTTTAGKDTVTAEVVTAVTGGPAKRCESDTLMPWAYPDPSGGLHQGTVTIRFLANKPCVISWRLASEEQWNDYDGGTIVIAKSDAVLFKAIDSCGNAMETREELYDIEPAKTVSLCPETMDLVAIGSMRFCIDRYEWPNRKGARPLAYVSRYQAADSCFSKGKRLCTSEEWSLACSGPYSWNYPYGQHYEPYACATSDTAPRPSGSKPECRAYFGSFDMAGNLAEWTSTPAKQDRQFNNVAGGFWESGPRSGCFDIRYSYYPQNRHNPVGFRCCRDLGGQER